MAWNTQQRTLELVSDALPTWYEKPLFVASRLRGTEKLGRLYDYEIDVSTIEAPGLFSSEMHKLVDVNKLVGKTLTVNVAIEGNGSWVQGVTLKEGSVNLGADVRELSGVIAGVKCLGSDDRRAFYRFRLRPWLWLASL